MTQKTSPEPGGCRAEGLSGPARQVHRAVLAAFARTGQPPGRGELERIARSHGADPGAVRAGSTVSCSPRPARPSPSTSPARRSACPVIRGAALEALPESRAEQAEAGVSHRAAPWLTYSQTIRRHGRKASEGGRGRMRGRRAAADRLAP